MKNYQKQSFDALRLGKAPIYPVPTKGYAKAQLFEWACEQGVTCPPSSETKAARIRAAVTRAIESRKVWLSPLGSTEGEPAC